MIVDQRIMDSANDVQSLNLHDVFMSDWVVEELSESEVDKEGSA